MVTVGGITEAVHTDDNEVRAAELIYAMSCPRVMLLLWSKLHGVAADYSAYYKRFTRGKPVCQELRSSTRKPIPASYPKHRD